MKFTLDLRTWRCGDFGDNKYGEGSTELENHGGYQCCLGFFSKQIDPQCQIRGRTEPENAAYSIPSENNILLSKSNDDELDNYFSNSLLSLDCIDINDNSYTNVLEKIKLLQKRLKKDGHTLEIKNDKLFDKNGRLINIDLLKNSLDKYNVENFIEGNISVKDFQKLSPFANQLIKKKGGEKAKKLLKKHLNKFDVR